MRQLGHLRFGDGRAAPTPPTLGLLVYHLGCASKSFGWGLCERVSIPLWTIGTQALCKENQPDWLINVHPGLTCFASEGTYQALVTFRHTTNLRALNQRGHGGQSPRTLSLPEGWAAVLG